MNPTNADHPTRNLRRPGQRSLGRLALAAAALVIAGSAAAQTYTVGVAVPPFGFNDPVTGQPAGYAVDLLNAIADDAGFDVDFVVHPAFGEVIPAVLAGTTDIGASSITVTTARIDMGLAFSGTYERHHDVLVVPDSDTRAYTSIEEFAGQPVMATAGTIYYNYLTQRANQFSAVLAPASASAAEITGPLLSGAAKAYLTPSFYAAYEYQRGGLQGTHVVKSYIPVLQSAGGLALRQGDTELLGLIQRSLSKLIANGTVATLAAKWGVAPP